MIIEYYAVLSREVQETEGKRRTGLEFQLVEKNRLSCFLDGGMNETLKASREQYEVFQMFQEFGVGDERFERVKCHYLGMTGFGAVTVYFESLEFMRYRYENWYLLRISNVSGELGVHEHECAIYEWGMVSDPEINSYGVLEMLPSEQASLLKKLYVPYIPEDSWTGSADEGTMVGAIGAHTQIDEVQFLYVGAALCVRIEQAGQLEAFFDLGTRVSQNPNLAAQYPSALLSYNTILADLNAIGPANQQTIFISHWHQDHCNALAQVTAAVLNTICNNTEWYVPASGTPVFQQIQNAVPAQNFHAGAAAIAYGLVNVNNNVNVQVGKIALPGGIHPHHRGLYIKLITVGGNQVFVVGDSTYEGIPLNERTNGGAGYDVLQACHHGGNYHYAPAAQLGANQYIPVAAQGATALYSADGIYHGHPNLVYVGEYRAAGYIQQNEIQLQLAAAAGFNFFFVN